MTPSQLSPLSPVRSFAVHLGHEIVWLMIAVLFCLVEALVFLTEIRPSKLFRRATVEVRRKPELSTTPAASQA